MRRYREQALRLEETPLTPSTERRGRKVSLPVGSQLEKVEPLDAASLKARLEVDPVTLNIAKNLGLNVKDYIEKVVFFMMNPKEQPKLRVVADDDIIKAGGTPFTQEEVDEWMRLITTGQIAIADESVAPVADAFGVAASDLRKAQLLARTGAEAQAKTAPHLTAKRGEIVVDEKASGNDLKNQMLRQRMQLGLGPSPSQKKQP